MLFRIRLNRIRVALSSAIWMIGIAWLVYDLRQDYPPFESLIALISGFLPLVELRKTDDKGEPTTYDFTSSRHHLNRENVLANVSSVLEGVLNQALPERVRIELGLTVAPEAIEATPVMWEGKAISQPIAPGTNIADLFLESGRAMLILGVPGAGKSFTLFELCKALLDKAVEDTKEPLPVVLNLSTWAERQLPLKDWIVYEMQRQYQLAMNVTKLWLEHEALSLLLDGLDEVRSDARNACVQAINDFRETMGGSIVVCSRIADYEELSERLNLSRAIVIEPLDEDQVKAYLTSNRLNLSGVYEAIRRDDALHEMVTTPLMLNIIAVAYRGITLEELEPLVKDEGTRRRHLYNAFVRRVFQRRKLEGVTYSLEQALRWLRFLAHQMTERSDTQFFIEDLQPDWLPSNRLRHYRIICRIVTAFVLGVPVGSLTGLSIGLAMNPITGLIFGLAAGIVGGPGLGLAFDLHYPEERQLGTHHNQLTIRTVDELVWKWPARDLLMKLLGACAALAVTLGLALAAAVGDDAGSLARLNAGLLGLLIGFFLFFTLFGLTLGTFERLQSKVRNKPSQGIYQSGKNGIRAGLFSAIWLTVLMTVVFNLFFSLRSWEFNELLSKSTIDIIARFLHGPLSNPDDPFQFILRRTMLVPALGMSGGFVIAFVSFGGRTVIYHCVLRTLLRATGDLPFRVENFLDIMSDRILIQRQGAHYQFLHRTMQEYMAFLTDEELTSLAAPPEESDKATHVENANWGS